MILTFRRRLRPHDPGVTGRATFDGRIDSHCSRDGTKRRDSVLLRDDKMVLKVANVITSFNSASGGPPRTVALMAHAGLGFWEAQLFTTNAIAATADSMLTNDFPGRVTILPARAQTAFRSLLMFSGLTPVHEAQLLSGVAPDVMHIHGIWSLFLSAFAATAIRHRIPYIVTPHGMLEPWSMSVHSWRKLAALRTYQGQLLAHAAAIHATSHTEAENLRRLRWIRSPIVVIPNSVDDPTGLIDAARNIPERKVLLFLSRIHEKKGLDLLLKAWNQARPRDWTLFIVGSGEQTYVDRLKRFCRTESVPHVEFYGHVDGDAREDMFRQASALVLPTYSENFGNVIAEALIRGLPVLTTTGTPWSIVADQGMGWYFRPDIEELRRVLAELEVTGPTALRAMGARGRKYAVANLSNSVVRGQLLEMYRNVAGSQ